MVETADINDEDGLREWLEGRTREEAIWIASRAAMRALPLFWEGATFFTDNNRDSEIIALLRNSLVSFLGGHNLSGDIGLVAARAHAMKYLHSKISHPGPDVFGGCIYVLTYAIAYPASATSPLSQNNLPVNHSTSRSCARTIFTSVAAFRSKSTHPAAIDELLSDCSHIESSRTLVHLALWKDERQLRLDQWLGIKRKAIEPEWNFWIKWYQDAIDGVEPNWDLLERIALIDNAIWDAGPKAVAAEIEKIEKQFELLREVRAVKASAAEVKAVAATVAQRSHNHPPELVDAESNLSERITLIWDVLDEAETELEKSHPEPSRLRAIADKLLELVIATTKYCASLADVVLNKAAEEIGTSGTKWAVRGVAAMWAVQQEPIRGFAGGLKDFVEMLLR